MILLPADLSRIAKNGATAANDNICLSWQNAFNLAINGYFLPLAKALPKHPPKPLPQMSASNARLKANKGGAENFFIKSR